MTAPRDPLAMARATLAGRRAWLVGGAIRDRARDRDGARARADAPDLDLVVDGEPREIARALARAARGERASAFALSEEHGAWRVVSASGAWQIDVERLRGDSLEEDLALRDFTVNAIAAPLDAWAADTEGLIDPLGGLADLAHGRLRAAGPRAFVDDPLRVLRLVRLAVELGLQPTPETFAAAAARAGDLRAVSPERVFAELRRVLAADRAREGLELMRRVGATAVVLPELDALRGVEQSRYHHLDVYEHTLEVLDRAIELGADPVAAAPAAISVEDAPRLTAIFAEPLGDGLTRGEALRWGALLHDIAKPATRAVSDDQGTDGQRRVTFLGHDRLGAELARAILARLRVSGRLREHVAALVRNHLRLGFLVHEPQPLARRTAFAYLRVCEPVEVDVTVLSVADRLATRGARAEGAIAAHLGLARDVLGDALRWRASGPPGPLLRGDELARELGIAPGPELGELLEELARARYAGEIATRAEAVAHARELRGARSA